MTEPTIFHHQQFREGRWRNGRGVSWDIASAGDETDFAWRFALARIDGDVPFSHYPGIDRVFTLIDGEGLDLDVAGVGTLPVHTRHEPSFFAGDAGCTCRVVNGPCTALNLFVRRDHFKPEVIVHETADRIDVGHAGTTLLYLLAGNAILGGQALKTGDAALLQAPDSLMPHGTAVIYEARLHT